MIDIKLNMLNILTKTEQALKTNTHTMKIIAILN